MLSGHLLGGLGQRDLRVANGELEDGALRPLGKQLHVLDLVEEARLGHHHALGVEGVGLSRLSRPREKHVYPPNDLDALEKALEAAAEGSRRALVVTDGSASTRRAMTCA